MPVNNIPRPLACALMILLAGPPGALAQTPASQPAGGEPAGYTASIRPGTYDLEITFGGGILEGLLVLTSSSDSLLVTLQVGGHESPIRSIRREQAQLILQGGSEGMDIRYQLGFQGDAVQGTFTYDGQAGTVSGKRRKP